MQAKKNASLKQVLSFIGGVDWDAYNEVCAALRDRHDTLLRIDMGVIGVGDEVTFKSGAETHMCLVDRKTKKYVYITCYKRVDGDGKATVVAKQTAKIHASLLSPSQGGLSKTDIVKSKKLHQKNIDAVASRVEFVGVNKTEEFLEMLKRGLK